MCKYAPKPSFRVYTNTVHLLWQDDIKYTDVNNNVTQYQISKTKSELNNNQIPRILHSFCGLNINKII